VPHEHGGAASRSPDLKALSYRFAVRCDDAALGAHIDALLGSLRDQADGDAAKASLYTLTASAERPGAVDLRRDDELLDAALAPGAAIDWLIWDVNRLAAERSGEHLLFHSGGVEASGVGILVPAASGSGKSTLTAGLVRAGLGYLSDELVALELDGARPGRLLPYPKPISVKAGSFGVLADMAPGEFAPGWFDAAGASGDGGEAGGEWQVRVGADTGLRVGSPCEPRLVVVPRYDAAATTTLTPLSETEAFFTLALHAVNMLPHGAAGPEVLGRLAAQCECYALAHSDLDEACAVVLGLVGARV
jgi:hypothetical protein